MLTPFRLAFAFTLTLALPAFAQDAPKEIDVALSNFAFTPDALTLKANTPYRLHLVNSGGSGHNFAAADFFAAFFLPVFFVGTFLPSALASERPIAIACFRLLTFLPDRPLFNVPALRFFIARSTLAAEPLEYFRAMRSLPVDSGK